MSLIERWCDYENVWVARAWSSGVVSKWPRLRIDLLEELELSLVSSSLRLPPHISALGFLNLTMLNSRRIQLSILTHNVNTKKLNINYYWDYIKRLLRIKKKSIEYQLKTNTINSTINQHTTNTHTLNVKIQVFIWIF